MLPCLWTSRRAVLLSPHRSCNSETPVSKIPCKQNSRDLPHIQIVFIYYTQLLTLPSIVKKGGVMKGKHQKFSILEKSYSDHVKTMSISKREQMLVKGRPFQWFQIALYLFSLIASSLGEEGESLLFQSFQACNLWLWILRKIQHNKILDFHPE